MVNIQLRKKNLIISPCIKIHKNVFHLKTQQLPISADEISQTKRKVISSGYTFLPETFSCGFFFFSFFFFFLFFFFSKQPEPLLSRKIYNLLDLYLVVLIRQCSNFPYYFSPLSRTWFPFILFFLFFLFPHLVSQREFSGKLKPRGIYCQLPSDTV